MAKRQSKESLLIAAIWAKFGGQFRVAKKLGVSQQLCNFWRNQGFVPMLRVGDVAKRLDIPALGLNFKKLKDLLGPDITWHDAVKAYKFEKAVETKLISMGN